MRALPQPCRVRGLAANHALNEEGRVVLFLHQECNPDFVVEQSGHTIMDNCRATFIDTLIQLESHPDEIRCSMPFLPSVGETIVFESTSYKVTSISHKAELDPVSSSIVISATKCSPEEDSFS